MKKLCIELDGVKIPIQSGEPEAPDFTLDGSANTGTFTDGVGEERSIVDGVLVKSEPPPYCCPRTLDLFDE